MKENLVVVLENRDSLAKIMAANLPILRDNTSFLFIIEDRIGTTEKIITENFDSSKIDYEIIKATDMITLWNETHKPSDFMTQHTMSAQMMYMWYIRHYCPEVKKVFYTDDDVVLKDDFEKVFDYEYSLFIPLFANGLPKDLDNASAKQKLLFNEFNKLFDFDMNDWSKLYKYYLGGGNAMLVMDQLDLDYYERCLERYYSSKIIEELTLAHVPGKADMGYFTNMHFLNYIWYKYYNRETTDLTKLKIVRVAISKITKVTDKELISFSKAPVLHICPGKTRIAWFNRLIDLKCIKGPKICEAFSNAFSGFSDPNDVIIEVDRNAKY